MKVTAFNGSPRKKGNTFIAINTVFDELDKEGIKTELVHVGGKLTKGCTDCGKCKKNKNGYCIIEDDIFNDCLKKMYGSEGVIIASPVYFGSVTPETKALIDRAGYCARSNDYLLKRKVGAAIVCLRRGGDVDAFNQINNLFFLNQMIIPCSVYWNMGLGRKIGEIKADKEGLENYRILGQNIAWTLKKLNA